MMQQTDKRPPAVRHSKEQINDIVAQYDPKQGLSIKKYCKLHRISEQSFYSARSRMQANGSAATNKYKLMQIQFVKRAYRRAIKKLSSR